MVDDMTEAETARELYARIRSDSSGMAPYRVVFLVAKMMKRDPFVVLNAIGAERVAQDDLAMGREPVLPSTDGHVGP